MRDSRLSFPRLVIFDLDGTLVDSVPDIAVALNAALTDLGLPRVAVADVRAWVGNGAEMLARRALARDFANPADAPEAQALYHRFLQRYGERVCEQSTVYPGAIECLNALRAAGSALACVTNKPHALALALLETLHMDQWFARVLGGDSLPRKKPHPAPLRHVLTALAVDPSQALMVGDSASDIAAARGAGIASVCVTYGYHQGQDVHALGADAVISTLAELPALLFERARRA